jgi:hypothetical protein
MFLSAFFFMVIVHCQAVDDFSVNGWNGSDVGGKKCGGNVVSRKMSLFLLNVHEGTVFGRSRGLFICTRR